MRNRVMSETREKDTKLGTDYKQEKKATKCGAFVESYSGLTLMRLVHSKLIWEMEIN